MVVALHGFLGSPSDFPPHLLALPLPALPFEEAVHQLYLQTLHLPPFSLFGYSMGGRLARLFSMIHPERLSCLIVASAHPGLKTGHKERLEADLLWIEKLQTLSFDSFLQLWYNRALFKTPVPNRRAEVRYLVALLENLTLAKQPLFEERVPTLELVGELDQAYRALLPHARLIEGAAHAVLYDNWPGVEHEMEQFRRLHRHPLP